MNIFIRYFLVFLISSNMAFAISKSYYQDKYNLTKKLYLGSVMQNNTKKQIEYLKKLINYGKKLHLNTLKYQRELNRIDKSTSVKKPVTTKFTYKPKTKKKPPKHKPKPKKITKKKHTVKKTKHKKKKHIKKQVKMLPPNVLYPSSKVIVIDPGHGGKDAGAVNKRIYEKNIVLKVGLYLRDELKKLGFKVYMTRYSNRFVKLPNRTKYANRKKANLFVSIHANSVRKSRAKYAHGIETYFLSPARSARAKRVAALENRGDMKKMGYSSKNSLLTILNQSKITASNKAAIDVQKNILYTLRKKYGTKHIRDAGVREGPFWVLVGAQMPSILIEVGYISHPIEGKRLNTRTYQKLIAKGIAKGIESYFIKNQ